MYIFVYLLTLCYFPFFFIYNVFTVAYRSGEPGVKFMLIIVDIPYQIVHTCQK